MRFDVDGDRLRVLARLADPAWYALVVAAANELKTFNADRLVLSVSDADAILFEFNVPSSVRRAALRYMDRWLAQQPLDQRRRLIIGINYRP